MAGFWRLAHSSIYNKFYLKCGYNLNKTNDHKGYNSCFGGIYPLEKPITLLAIFVVHTFVWHFDLHKAFDSVDHTFIISCLKQFNFREDFIRWVQLFYHGAKSCVSNNGNMSKFFPIQRGASQGCPLSTYLFIICI